MTNQEIFSHIDHTLLTPTATWSEIETLCRQAMEYQTASVCVPPCYISPIRRQFEDQIPICTVIGFPLGYHTTSTKIAEAEQALKDGAAELDMVINITDVKNGDLQKVQSEIATLRALTGGAHILKVIVETCYLTPEEKVALCHAVTLAGADYIKTSTGFGTAGATLEDVKLFKAHIGPLVKIKAAGGMRTRKDMVAFLQAGCHRLGTSSGVSILTQGEAQGY